MYLPGLSRALSRMSGLLVPASTTTPEVVWKPSISTSSWFRVFSRSSFPPAKPPRPRARPMASISSAGPACKIHDTASGTASGSDAFAWPQKTKQQIMCEHQIVCESSVKNAACPLTQCRSQSHALHAQLRVTAHIVTRKADCVHAKSLLQANPATAD